ncbi:MAG: hypothetical protein ACP5I4_01870 [Oceanipulchritudo sp.]
MPAGAPRGSTIFREEPFFLKRGESNQVHIVVLEEWIHGGDAVALAGEPRIYPVVEAMIHALDKV